MSNGNPLQNLPPSATFTYNFAPSPVAVGATSTPLYNTNTTTLGKTLTVSSPQGASGVVWINPIPGAAAVVGVGFPVAPGYAISFGSAVLPIPVGGQISAISSSGTVNVSLAGG